MTAPAERMRAMRARRREGDMREVRLILPDARRRSVRERVAEAVSKLDNEAETEAMAWIESVSIFDEAADDTQR